MIYPIKAVNIASKFLYKLARSYHSVRAIASFSCFPKENNYAQESFVSTTSFISYFL